MNKVKTVSGVVLVSALLLVGFQNCNNTKSDDEGVLSEAEFASSSFARGRAPAEIPEGTDISPGAIPPGIKPPTATRPPGVLPPAPVGCPTSWQGQPWANYSRRADQTRFTHLLRHDGQGYAAEFPNFGGNNTLESSANEYVSLQFEALPRYDRNGPSGNNLPDGVLDINDFYGRDNLRTFIWAESQGGFPANLYDGSGRAGVYFSISECPGDFRMPTSYSAPANDSTLSFACRNIMPRPTWWDPSYLPGQSLVPAGLEYEVSLPSSYRPSSLDGCGLQYGKTYYLNFMVVNPIDGYQLNERSCNFVPGTNPPLSTRCGVQLHARP